MRTLRAGEIMRQSILIFLLQGQFASNTEGHRGTSNSMQDSKERKVFIAEYELQSTDDNINKIIKEQIQDAFLEYGCFVKRIEKENTYWASHCSRTTEYNKSEVDELRTYRIDCAGSQRSITAIKTCVTVEVSRKTDTRTGARRTAHIVP